KTETAARAETAAPGPEVSGKHTGAAHPYPGRIHSPAGAAQKRGHWGHHRDVRFRAHRIARNGAGAMHAAEKREDLEALRSQAGEAPRGRAACEKLAGDVALLRRSAAAFAQADHLVAHARAQA